MLGSPREARVIAGAHAGFTRGCGRVHAAIGLDPDMMIRALALAFVAAAAAAPARADTIELVPTCVRSNADELAPPDRTLAVTMLRRALEEHGVLVVDTGCVDIYTVFHERTGDDIVAHVRGPRGGRKLHVTDPATLPDAYERMVKDLLAEPPATVDVPAPATAQAPIEPPAPRVVHHALYFQAGIGGMGGAHAPHSIAGGYRYERSGTAFDTAITEYSSSSDSTTDTEAVTGKRLTFKILHTLASNLGKSFYAGGGVGVGGSTIQLVYSSYSGSGVEGIATAGVDLLHTSGLRMFMQADVVLPAYMMTSSATGETEYAGSVMFSLGLGFGD
jgi:hypothetical protein